MLVSDPLDAAAYRTSYLRRGIGVLACGAPVLLLVASMVSAVIAGDRPDALGSVAMVVAIAIAALNFYLPAVRPPAMGSSGEMLANARKALLSARSRTAVLKDIARWLRARPSGDLSNILDMVVALLASESRDVRLNAIVAVKAHVIASPGPIRDWWFRTISTIAEGDPSYAVQAMALDTLRRAELTGEQGLECYQLAARANASQIAIERRLGTLLATVSGTSRRGKLRRATSARTRR